SISFGREPALAAELAARLHPPKATLRMSVSQLEKFAACPLQYFFHYTLALRPRQAFEVNVLGLGLLQHRILEGFYRRVIDENLAWPGMDKELMRKLVGEEVDAAVEELHAEIAERTPGYDKLCQRLK